MNIYVNKREIKALKFAREQLSELDKASYLAGLNPKKELKDTISLINDLYNKCI